MSDPIFYFDEQKKPVHLGSYVRTLTHNQTGRITGLHDRCKQGAAWLSGQADQRVSKLVDQPWADVLVHGGGSIHVPLALVSLVEPFKMNNSWEWDYFGDQPKAEEEASMHIAFSAGRRGAGSIDCKVCGTAIHQRPDGTDDPTGPWFDGSGDTVGLTRGESSNHAHTPAAEIGPVLGPFAGYVDLTYNTVRHEGELIAYFDDRRGDWIIEAEGPHQGEAYSDLTINVGKEA